MRRQHGWIEGFEMVDAVYEDLPDRDVWPLVRAGKASAFEILVRRYQSLICVLAYNICGNLQLSEDIAQETFWAAWRERESLRDVERLREWLCGIARNQARNAVRHAIRPVAVTALLTPADDLADPDAGPMQTAVSKEEESLVWQSLSEIPELYREPLILFYREDQSIAQVAAELDLTPDVVKQRLSRGRAMLRERVVDVVEGTLRRSRPGTALTTLIMAGLTAATVGSKTAMAGTVTAGAIAVKPIVAGSLASGPLAGLMGSLFGMAGGWLGTWLPAQLAPSKTERTLIQRVGLRMMIVTLLLTAAMTGLAFARPYLGLPWIAIWVPLFVSFWVYSLVETVLLSRQVKLVRTQNHEPNDTYLRTKANAISNRFQGRVYRSRTCFLGYPLIDINVSDPVPLNGNAQPPSSLRDRRVAEGWIAIGDNARGILLAVARSFAAGLIAIGGRSIGVISLGGVTAGLIACGGIGIGVVTVAGLSVGGLAIGGMAVGWQAAGGFAVASDVACGGGAFAWRAALGGLAAARDFAIGGEAHARHANDELAKAVLLNHPLKHGMDWYLAHIFQFNVVIVAVALLGPSVGCLLMYRKNDESSKEPTTK